MILQDQVKIFCYFGLLPFISIPIISWISPETALNYYLIYFFFTWSLMMATFMGGTIWGLSLNQDKSIYDAVVIFTAVLLLSVFLTFSSMGYTILALAILILIYEFIHFSERKLIAKFNWYKEVRFHLTFSIRICHLLMIAFIFTNQ